MVDKDGTRDGFNLQAWQRYEAVCRLATRQQDSIFDEEGYFAKRMKVNAWDADELLAARSSVFFHV